MKQLITIGLLLMSLRSFSFEEGGHGVGNGGDSSEVRFVAITQDLYSWIMNGGSEYLNLPTDLSLNEYNSKMIALVTPYATVISFTNDTILVSGVEKTCKNYVSVKDKKPNILCNIQRFNNTSEAGQYQLVHHEFAGLAGFEKNVGSSSDYIISSQLTDFLKEETILKLAVKPGEKPDYNEMVMQEAKRAGVFHAKMANISAYARIHEGVCESPTGYLSTILDHYLKAVENDPKIIFNREVYEVLGPYLSFKVAEKLRNKDEYGHVNTSYLLKQFLIDEVTPEDFNNAYFETSGAGVYGSYLNFTLNKNGSFNFEKLIVEDTGDYHWEKASGQWKIVSQSLGNGVVLLLDFGAKYKLPKYYKLQYEAGIFRLGPKEPISEDDQDESTFYSTLTSECEV